MWATRARHSTVPSGHLTPVRSAGRLPARNAVTLIERSFMRSQYRRVWFARRATTVVGGWSVGVAVMDIGEVFVFVGERHVSVLRR